MKCMYMLTHQYSFTVYFTAKEGLAPNVMLNCTGPSDSDWTYSSYLSTSVKSDERNRFDEVSLIWRQTFN